MYHQRKRNILLFYKYFNKETDHSLFIKVPVIQKVKTFVVLCQNLASEFVLANLKKFKSITLLIRETLNDMSLPVSSIPCGLEAQFLSIS